MTDVPIEGSAWSNANRLADDKLAALLRKYHRQGKSYRQIAGLLGTKHGVDTSYTTVQSWLTKLGELP